MRKVFYAVNLALMLGLASCQSDSPIVSDIDESIESVGVVSFAISTEFSEEMSMLRSENHLPSDSDIEILEYIAIRTDRDKDQFIKRKTFTKDEYHSSITPELRLFKSSNLINITDTLPVGNYEVVLVASTEKSSFTPSILYGLLGNVYSFFLLGMGLPGDVFLKEAFEIKVGEEYKKESLKLSRVKGKIEIVISDADQIPSDVESVYFEFPAGIQPAGTFYLADGGSVLESSASPSLFIRPISRNDILTVSENNPISRFMTPTDFEGNESWNVLEVPLYACIIKKDGTRVSKLVKRDLNIYRNKITRLTGNLFTDDFGIEPSIDNTEWGETIEENFD